MLKKKTSDNEDLYGELGQAFNFTQGDLEANRAGFISHRQKQARWKSFRDFLSVWLIITIIFCLVFPIVSLSSGNDYGALWVLSIPATLFLLFVLMSIPLLRDTYFGRIQQIVTPVRLEKHSLRSGDVLYLMAGESKFSVSDKAKVFEWKPDIVYRIFFLPKSKWILSIEEFQPEEG